MTDRRSTADPVLRVSNVELFFELVFVFAITQLTGLLELAHEPLDFVKTLLILVLIWWMYAGYVWLTNVTGVDARMRVVLIAAMGGFLVIGAAVPGVYHEDGLAFGVAYLFVVVLHLITFRVQGGKEFGKAVLLLAPFNLGAAALAIAAGVVDADWDWLLIAGAVTPFILATLSGREQGFEMNPGHFVDRHAGVMIIALGETVVAIGAGSSGHALDPITVTAMALSLVLIASVWWVYFSRDHELAEAALERATQSKRAQLAVRAYWYPFIAMLFGVVLVATGIHEMIANPMLEAGRGAWLIAGGMAIYLLGSALFRVLVGSRRVGGRLGGAAVAVVLGGVAAGTPAIAWLAGAAAAALILIAVEERGGRGHAPPKKDQIEPVA